MESARVHYFGYGSLVNRDTRPCDERSINATLSGFRRAWNHRVTPQAHIGRPDVRRARPGSTSLSVDPAESAIDGVIVEMPAGDLVGLDARESGYDRLSLPASRFLIDRQALSELDIRLHEDDTVYLYRSKPLNRQFADESYPILQSYVDCVFAGYLSRFGETGLDAFIDTTHGWTGARRNDRDVPDYPRAVPLPAHLQPLFDHRLARLPVEDPRRKQTG